MKRSDELKKHLRPGQVYRREELAKWSTAVDRHLSQLMSDGTLTKLAGGLYFYPRQTVFGKAPPEDTELVASFLKDDRFLLLSPNAYNRLGVGTTQLYNKTVVYNRKRHGKFTLGGRSFDFRLKPSFPRKPTEEFLLVDLVNNLNQLAESRQEVLAQVKKRATTSFDVPRLKRAARNYGNVKTQKFFADALNAPHAG
ncbi:hypothetical protein [Taklimakanibacter lacteus]|uniref:hypothetical protein n=1 Tax=Taklimakanibacter lacteus TaxID=2268456 RepID=UPI000E66172E